LFVVRHRRCVRGRFKDLGADVRNRIGAMHHCIPSCAADQSDQEKQEIE
jgi:hypothetical protein